MYVRQIRQYLRNADEAFDERKLGFGGIVDFLRACQREGLLRLERDRQGVMRVFPGASFPKQAAAASPDDQASTPGVATEPSFDGGEPVVIVEQPRFHRITDDVVDEPSEIVIETVPVEGTTRPAEYEEDLSVGPGNVAGRETHTMTTTAKVGRPARHAVRKGAPRGPKAEPAARVARTPRRAPRSRKPKE